MDSDWYIYHLVVWSNFNLLHNSQWITFPIRPCLVLFSLYTCLLHLLIMKLPVLSPSPHKCALAIQSRIIDFRYSRMVRMVLFCAGMRRDSVYLLKFPFHGYVQVFSEGVSPVCRLKSPYGCFSFHLYYYCVFTYIFNAVTGRCN